MTEIIIHRVNKISELNKINPKYGIEIDVRAHGSKLILNHEPYRKGDLLDDYLDNYKHGTLILNVKESGIEYDIIKKLKNKKLREYFLLDVEFPFIYHSLKEHYKNFSLRFSEFESLSLTKKLIGKVNWVWIDTFTKLPIKKSNINILKKFRTCLVCPERWGRPHDINKMIKMLSELNYYPNAVMTSKKYIKQWEAISNL